MIVSGIETGPMLRLLQRCSSQCGSRSLQQARGRFAPAVPCVPVRFVQVNGNQVRIGNVLEYKGKLVLVRRAQSVKPGKGGAYMQVELKDIRTGQKYNERLRASEGVERVRLDDEITYDYLYTEGDKMVLMNKEDFTQLEVPLEMLSEEEQRFLEEGCSVRVQPYDGAPLIVRLQKEVIVTIESTDPYSKGAQAAPTYKPAKLTNGAMIKVPPFIEQGEKVILSTETMEYVSRASETGKK